MPLHLVPFESYKMKGHAKDKKPPFDVTSLLSSSNASVCGIRQMRPTWLPSAVLSSRYAKELANASMGGTAKKNQKKKRLASVSAQVYLRAEGLEPYLRGILSVGSHI